MSSQQGSASSNGQVARSHAPQKCRGASDTHGAMQ